MTYLPDVTVEIAFDSGYSTPAVDRTWTDVTEWWEASEGYSITRGRQDELTEAGPSTLSLTFDNTDGRFTPGRSSSPYYPNVKIGRPIRVTVTPAGGTPSVRFVGYVDEWPVEWDGTDAYARAAITATSRTARLGQNAALRTALEEEILLLGPVAYYTLGEAEGATQGNDSSDGDVAPMQVWDIGGSTAPAFGQGIGPSTDGLAGVRTAQSGDALEAVIDAPAGSDWSVLWWFTTEETSVSGMLGWGGLYVNHGTWSTGELSLESVGDPGDEDSTDAYSDGLLHWGLLTWEQATLTARLYIDGIEGANRVGDPGPFGLLTLGANRSTNFVAGFADTPDPVYVIDAHFFHAAVFDRILDVGGGELANTLVAANLGFVYLPGFGIGRLAEMGGVPSAERSLADGVDTVAGLDLSGKSAVAAMQEIAATDGGILYDARDGTLTYQARDVRYSTEPTATLSVATQQVQADYSPKLDRSALLNDVTAANADDTLSVRVTDATSRDEYGTFSESLTLLTSDEDALRAAADWRINTRAEPSLRAPTLSVDVLNVDEATQAALLELDVSSRVTVNDLPSQAAASTGDYFVEGYTESLTDVTYTLSLNVSDGAAWLTTAQFDVAGRGFDVSRFAY